MSHFSRVKIAISDLKALARACKNLDLKLDTTVKKHSSTWAGEIDCAGVITSNKVSGSAGIVLDKETNTYKIEWDSYNNDLRDVIGTKAEKLTREYAVEMVLQQASSIGVVSSIETKNDGSVVVVGCFV